MDLSALEKQILNPTEPDDDDVRRDDSGDDLPPQVVEPGEPGAPAMPPPRLRRRGNTGVKGVLADYAEAKARSGGRGGLSVAFFLLLLMRILRDG